MRKRILSIITALAMCFSMLPAWALAAEQQEDTGLCEHHQEHTIECGYREAAEGQPCGHIHDGTCGFVAAAEEIPCNMDCAEIGEDGQIIHAEGCSYVPATEGVSCQHEHNSECGYAPAIEGTPCGFVCPVCPVQAMIDALPDADSITASSRASVEGQLAAIDAARMELTDEETEQLDMTRYQTAISALSALDGQAGADVPMLAADAVSYLACDENGQDWTTESCTDYTEITSDNMPTTWDGGWYVVSGGDAENPITFSELVTVNGEVHLILEDGCNLTVNGGIIVNANNSFTVYAQSKDENTMGSLSAIGSNRSAGIGSSRENAGGTIIIHGGNVTAKGAGTGAGIGGGFQGAGDTIIIYGGNIEANGGSNGGAGVGGGRGKDGGTIIIHGGNIETNGNDGGAGIGGGASGAGGAITINGGTVTATGGGQGTGIGGGLGGGGGVITITGGTVTATAGSVSWNYYGGAGIGSGGYADAGSSTITITGGTVTATGRGIGGSGIGNGGSQNNSGSTFSTGSNGNAFIITNSISDKSDRTSWSGIIFEDNSGQVYGDQTLSEDMEIPSGKTLTIPEGTTLTILADVTFTNNGTITGDGTITGSGNLNMQVTFDAKGGSVTSKTKQVTYNKPYGDLPAPTRDGYTFVGWFTAASGGDEITDSSTVTQWNKHTLYAYWQQNSAVAVTFSDDPTYNGRLTITATIGAAPTNALFSAALNTVDFYLGNVSDSNKLNTDAVPVSSSMATLIVDLTGERWTPGEKTITAVFNGSDTYTGSTGTGTVTIARTPNSITSLSCADVVFGNTPNPSATASQGTPSFTYSNSENGSYGAWNSSNAKGTWYVKASVEGTDIYEGAEKVIAFSVTAERELTPNASINYTDETLTGLENGASYSITPAGGAAVTVTASSSGTINIQADWIGKTLSIVKTARDSNYSDSDAQSLSIPLRPATPTTPLKLTKTSNSITITNSYPGCEFSADGTSWNDNGAFTSLTAGTSYTVQVRVKAAAGSFRSASMTQAVTTVAADGSTTVKPGETVTTGGSTITNDGDKTTITSGGSTTTVTPGNDVTVNGDGTVTVPGGSTVQTGSGPEITVGPGNSGTIGGGDGGVTVPDGGSVQVGSDPATTITPPNGGEVKPNPDGTMTVPGGSTVQTGSSPEITVGPGNGGTVGGDGGITVPDGGSVQVGNDPATTITPPNGGEITPNPDGTVTVPDGTTVQTGSGPEITVGPGNGGTVGGNGGVTVPDGGSVQVGSSPATTITPPNGGEVKPNPDGTISLPGGTVVTPAGKDPITVPDSGGTYHPDTGTVTENVHTVTFNSQGGSAVSPVTVTHGRTAAKPGNPTRSGYTFGGWYKESSCTTAWNFDTDTVTGDITLYAKWTEIPPVTYSVSFDSQGGSAVASQSVTKNGKAAKPSNPARSGYTFGGWYRESSCTTAWNFDTDTVTGDITLYAKWTQNSGGGGGGGGGGWYTPPTYPPTVEKPSEGGTVAVSPGRPSTGDKVTVRPKPDSGYEVEKVTVTDKNGRPVTVTKNPDGTYSFIQPNSTVKVEVIYRPTETPWSNPFRDVAETAWYYEAVRYVSENGLMNGYSDGRFGPNDNLSRAQLAQILFNKEGRPMVNFLLQFNDVPGEVWYTEAIRWATSQGIVGGYGNGMFGPNDNITREQLAVMLWRYAGSPAATNKELHFADVDKISGYALEALRWAVENGIINGYGDGRLSPDGLATRAQVAQMLKNFLEN